MKGEPLDIHFKRSWGKSYYEDWPCFTSTVVRGKDTNYGEKSKVKSPNIRDSIP